MYATPYTTEGAGAQPTESSLEQNGQSVIPPINAPVAQQTQPAPSQASREQTINSSGTNVTNQHEETEARAMDMDYNYRGYYTQKQNPYYRRPNREPELGIMGKLSRVILIIFNLLLLAMCVVVLTFACAVYLGKLSFFLSDAIVRKELVEKIQFGLQESIITIMIVSGVMLILTALSMYGITTKKLCFPCLCGIALTLILFAQVAVVIMMAMGQKKLADISTKIAITDPPSSKITGAFIKHIQDGLECCGVMSYREWAYNPLIQQSSEIAHDVGEGYEKWKSVFLLLNNTEDFIPHAALATCCVDRALCREGENYTMAFNRQEGLHEAGCYTKVSKSIVQFQAVAAVYFGIQFVVIVATLIFYSAVKKTEKKPRFVPTV